VVRDVDIIQLILENALTNALHHGLDGTQVQLSAKAADDTGEKAIVICVSNQVKEGYVLKNGFKSDVHGNLKPFVPSPMGEVTESREEHVFPQSALIKSRTDSARSQPSIKTRGLNEGLGMSIIQKCCKKARYKCHFAQTSKKMVTLSLHLPKASRHKLRQDREPKGKQRFSIDIRGNSAQLETDLYLAKKAQGKTAMPEHDSTVLSGFGKTSLNYFVRKNKSRRKLLDEHETDEYEKHGSVESRSVSHTVSVHSFDSFLHKREEQPRLAFANGAISYVQREPLIRFSHNTNKTFPKAGVSDPNAAYDNGEGVGTYLSNFAAVDRNGTCSNISTNTNTNNYRLLPNELTQQLDDEIDNKNATLSYSSLQKSPQSLLTKTNVRPTITAEQQASSEIMNSLTSTKDGKMGSETKAKETNSILKETKRNNEAIKSERKSGQSAGKRASYGNASMPKICCVEDERLIRKM